MPMTMCTRNQCLSLPSRAGHAHACAADTRTDQHHDAADEARYIRYPSQEGSGHLREHPVSATRPRPLPSMSRLPRRLRSAFLCPAEPAGCRVQAMHATFDIVVLPRLDTISVVLILILGYARRF